MYRPFAGLAMGCVCMLLAPQERREVVSAPRQAVAAAAFAADDPLPTNGDMERLAKTDPIAFLQNCLRRYQQEVKGYRCVMEKQEMIGGRLLPRDVVDVYFRESPHSVYMQWREGGGLVERTLYVEGENDGKLLGRPKGVAARLVAGAVVARDPEGPEAMRSSRYSLKEFGLKKSTERILKAWMGGKENNALKVEYQGIQKIRQTGDRPCFVLRRILDKPENEGCTDATYYFDSETWLLAGSILKGEGGAVMGIYYFRDVRINPEFKPIQFTRAALTP